MNSKKDDQRYATALRKEMENPAFWRIYALLLLKERKERRDCLIKELEAAEEDVQSAGRMVSQVTLGEPHTEYGFE
ncbi:hypothetical protein BD626DRAFT_576204 [Schizophyllum amplum]|uniref:Uncharacterized protein n=1 Tax=Schizophyllum amplum TaxID=97359 RepID=A0A550BU13_9AGAR|nr:hypothetical protein BD626DRAFT_576204 [Auriculariopsis ampla]